MKLTKEQVEEVFRKSRENIERFPQWRIGQSFFNTLWDMHPDIANEINGTEYDPFYDTGRMTSCIEFITEEQKNEI